MYHLKTIVNDVCNLDFNGIYDTKEEALAALSGYKSSFDVISGVEHQYKITNITDKVTVYTLNMRRPIGGNVMVYTFYLIEEGE